MKHTEITALMNAVKYQPTKRLNDLMVKLTLFEKERQLTKSMYFWDDFGNAQKRAAFSRRYSNDETIQIAKDFAVRYVREVSPTRENAHASDSLWAVSGGQDVSFTLADSKKLVEAMHAIVAKREAGKTARAHKKV